jgi:hypothetical protein
MENDLVAIAPRSVTCLAQILRLPRFTDGQLKRFTIRYRLICAISTLNEGRVHSYAGLSVGK